MILSSRAWSWAVGVLLVFGSSFAARASVEYDSALNVAVDATIDNGQVITNSEDDAAATAQVIEQLKYSIGQLNAFGGGIDMARTSIQIKDKKALDGGLFQITYTAKALVSWPREYQIPSSFNFLLPKGSYPAALQYYFEQLGNDEHTTKNCLADDAHDMSTGSFWYYIRPLKQTCALLNPASAARSLTKLTMAKLARSAVNTQGKSPEYGKIWEDGKLVATIVYGKETAGTTSINDAGIAAYRQFYAGLIQNFGYPVSNTLPNGVYPSAATPEVRMVFNTTRGKMDIALFLVDVITSTDATFQKHFQDRTMISDYVAYGGHAGLGDNIRAFLDLGRYAPNQYQVFLLNGCDTFAYAGEKLRADHLAVNPNSSPDKFVDVITNARPSLFNYMPVATLRVLVSLFQKQATYQQILAGFEGSQRASVMGEEDNTWPGPFLP